VKVDVRVRVNVNVEVGGEGNIKKIVEAKNAKNKGLILSIG